MVTNVDDHGVSIGDEEDRRRHGVVGRWRHGVTRGFAPMGAPLDRAGRVPAEPTL